MAASNQAAIRYHDFSRDLGVIKALNPDVIYGRFILDSLNLHTQNLLLRSIVDNTKKVFRTLIDNRKKFLLFFCKVRTT